MTNDKRRMTSDERPPRLRLIRVFLSLLAGFMAGRVGRMVVLLVLLGSSQATPLVARTSAAEDFIVPRVEGNLSVQVWLTTGDESVKLQRQPDVSFRPGRGSDSRQIIVDERTRYQQMDGFGAAITDSSAWLITNRLSPDRRNALMIELFSPSSGIGISYVRLPMGASDFALTPYTYDDVPSGQSDPNLDLFSIAHDRPYILPIIRQAMSINPQLGFLASPWSPPAWMKASPVLNGSWLLPGNYRTYANYFVKFIQAYQAEGIPIHAVTVQNEPHFTNSTYPTMYMESSAQAEFVRDYLGPAFADAGITTKILAWDHNWSEPDYPLAVLGDAVARSFVAGSAWHCYSGKPDAQSTVHDAYPDKDVYFTECSGGEWRPGFANNLVWFTRTVVIGAIRNWAKAVVLWNLALDENHGPRIGGCEGCRGVVTIHPQSGAVSYEVEYYILGHVTKFVAPGARRIASDAEDQAAESVAFLNPDDSLALIVLNPSPIPMTFDVQWSGHYFSYSLPAESVATFKWAGNHTIAGRVTSSNSSPVPGVTVWAGDALSATTSVTGDYRFTNLDPGTYTLMPSKTDYVFVPPSRTVTVPQGSLYEDFVMLPGPVSTTLALSGTVSLPASLTYTDTQGLTTTLDFPANAVSQTTTIMLIPTLAWDRSGFAFAGHAFDIATFQNGSLVPELILDAPVAVTIHYSSDDVRLVTDENRLVLARWAGVEWQDALQTCEPASSYIRDVTNRVLSVPICRLGRFALFGPTHQVYLPVLMHNN